MFQLYSELTITKQERHPWSYSGVFIINFEQISHCSGVSIIDFEQINGGWENFKYEFRPRRIFCGK